MARSKSRKKKKVQVVKLKPENYIRKKARSLPIHKSYINTNWEEMGMAVIIITRQKASGNLVLGFYLVDTGCLGLKNTGFAHNLMEGEFTNVLEQQYKGMNLEHMEIDTTLAFNIIYGAVEYAEDLGFSPHKDFKISEYILDDVEAVEFKTVEFGKDGKPFFVASPHDDIDRVMAILNKKVGPGNFEYLFPFADEDDEDYDYDEEEGEAEVIDELIEDFLPSPKVEAVRASIADDSDQEKYDLQVEIAEVIIDFKEGDLQDFAKKYNSDFKNDILSEMEDRLLGEDEDVLPDDLQDLLDAQLETVLEHIKINNSVEFLLKEGYQP